MHEARAEPRRHEIELVADDGYRLAATEHRGTEEPRGVVVVQGATAVARRFYVRLADHLAERGFHALTFDYRGVCGSLHGSIRELDADMMDWARRDAAAARAHGARLAGDRPLFLFSHSFGGQAVAIEPPAEPVSGAVFVGCQEGDIRLWPRYRIPWFLFGVGVVIPLFSRLLGYVPGSVGFGEDLPGGVASQWARWCRTRGYVFGVHPELADRAATVAFPILSLSFSDDHYAPPRAVDALLRRFPNAETEHRHHRPADLGVPSIGHFGFFRSNRSELWDEPARWMEGLAGP
jgi:predicted alpha/beta hydrolase